MIRTILLTRINLVLLGLLVAVTIYALINVPPEAVVPVHWGVDGQADGFVGRNQAFLMLPGIALVLLGGLAGFIALAGPRRVEGGQHGLATAVSGLLLLFLAIQVGTLLLASGLEVDMVRLIMLAVAVLLIAVGNVLPKSRPNRIAGIRLPWTLADSGNWRATHRLVGTLLMLGGGVLALLALMPVPPALLLAGLLAAVAVPLLAGSVYSYRLSKRA